MLTFNCEIYAVMIYKWTCSLLNAIQICCRVHGSALVVAKCVELTKRYLPRCGCIYSGAPGGPCMSCSAGSPPCNLRRFRPSADTLIRIAAWCSSAPGLGEQAASPSGRCHSYRAHMRRLYLGWTLTISGCGGRAGQIPRVPPGSRCEAGRGQHTAARDSTVSLE